MSIREGRQKKDNRRRRTSTQMRMRQRQRRERGRSQYNTETHHKKREVLCTRTIIVVGKMEAGLLGDFHLLAQVEQDVGELLLRATDEIFKPRRDDPNFTISLTTMEPANILAPKCSCARLSRCCCWKIFSFFTDQV